MNALLPKLFLLSFWKSVEWCGVKWNQSLQTLLSVKHDWQPLFYEVTEADNLSSVTLINYSVMLTQLGHKPWVIMMCPCFANPSRFDIVLMKEGRMKGQAFVGLPSEQSAEKALRETNGYVLYDKPLVVVSFYPLSDDETGQGFYNKWKWR